MGVFMTGYLKKHGEQAQKYRQTTLEAEIQPAELENVAQAVAAGLVTPAPGLHGNAQGQQGVGVPAPMTPALPTPSTKREHGEQESAREAKRQDITESPRKTANKRGTPMAEVRKPDGGNARAHERMIKNFEKGLKQARRQRDDNLRMITSPTHV